jgi:plastocyanin
LFRSSILIALLACAAAPARANIIDVTQSGFFAFTPANVTIEVGDTVRWTWASLSHTVTEGNDGTVNGNEAFNGLLDTTHQTFLHTFDAAFLAAHPRPGNVYQYFCAPHFPVMVGTVTVNVGTGTPFCFGDGSGTACPCGNASAVGANAGCLNSLATGGKLTGQGTSSVSADSFALHGSGMPNSSVLYFQGTTSVAGGAGTAFGDGLRCAGGSVIRLGIETNASGTSQFPGAGDPPISVQGAAQAGDVRMYQAWYRNAAAYCTTDTFNLTNGLSVSWSP